MKPELLAPAGDLNRLKMALYYGADAVYIGSAYNLRANANNFTIEDIKEGVKYAHKHNKKVYVTVNISPHNKEMENIKEYLKELDKIKVDAIIVTDPAIVKCAKENTNLQVHLSTQTSTLNKQAAQYWKNQGVSRIVLARECTKEDIKDIKENVDIELEVFIHGAICSSYSGRCVMSNYLTNRDSNRGGCSQICRWSFDLIDNNEIIKAEKPFTFSTKDLSMLKYIPDLIDLKVDSLKIEGRMRSEYYIATIVKVYRSTIDNYLKGNYKYNIEDEKTLRKCANRDSIPQFFNGIFDHTVQYYNEEIITNQDFVAKVISYNKPYAQIQQRNYFQKGDELIVFGPTEEFKYKVDKMYNEDMEEITVANHPKEIIYLPMQKVQKNYLIKKVDKSKNV